MEAKCIPFNGASPMIAGMIAGDVQIGFTDTLSTFRVISRGVPVLVVAELLSLHHWRILVQPASPIKEPRELKGMTIGISNHLTVEHLSALVALKRLGFEEKKDVKIVALGGVPSKTAAFIAKRVDAIVSAPTSDQGLVTMGKARVLLDISPYFPKDWTATGIIAHKDIVKNNPDLVKRTVRAILQGSKYFKDHPDWGKEQIKAFTEWPDAAVEEIYRLYSPLYSIDGKLTYETVNTIRRYAIENGIIPEQEAAPPNLVFTDQFFR